MASENRIIDGRDHDPARAIGNGQGDDDVPVILQPEIPAAVTFNGKSHAVMMVSPHDLEDFIIGFTLSEGIADHIGQITLRDVRKTLQGFVIEADLDENILERLDVRQRTLEGRSGCGLCGVQSLDAVAMDKIGKVVPGNMAQDVVLRAIDALPDHQTRNREGGGLLHASAFVDGTGTIQIVREDIGRHNALDKVLGAVARAGIDKTGGFILMTSRCSYEIVTKTVQCGVGGLVTLSGPTLTAVNLARQAGLTMICRERHGLFRRFS
ncbi:formate dehydrogenase accessory sulfurtransferase FdhD [Thalassospira alkalitolerans]|uniref:formate dehydrogenase accessory sulfurtransferase FdhD n=1 Tax=Thalassospira alkalitolerans TaxID=1293890 RepID=UPI0030ECB9D7|tara:strand:- start:50986 stop:51786 length:801 start_codon:yes stop_codon:yes gene_type:complete